MRIYGYKCVVSYVDPGDRLRKDINVDFISQRQLPQGLVVRSMMQRAAHIAKTWRIETDLRDTPTSQLALVVESCTESIGEE